MMDELPNNTVLFRHAMRLFPLVFRHTVEDDYPIFKLHVCRTIISASTLLNSPTKMSTDHKRLIGLDDLLEEGEYSHQKVLRDVSIPTWSNSSTSQKMTWLEAAPVSSAKRALAATLGTDLDNQFIMPLQNEIDFFGILKELNKDLSIDEVELKKRPLWASRPGEAGEAEALLTVGLEFAKPREEDKWSFWRDWYAAHLVGEPMNPALEECIAFLPDEVWEAGVDEVAHGVERIKAELLSKTLPQAETIEYNQETERFYAVPISAQNLSLLSATLTAVHDALEDALHGDNGLTIRSSEFRKITRVVTRYGNDPQQAELTLTTVAKGLRRQIYETSELPNNVDNLALLDAVEESVRGIRANHPEVAANREQLAKQAFGELRDEDMLLLSKAQPILAGISEGGLAEDFAEDIPSLINDSLLPLPSGAPPLPGTDAATRIFSRVSKIALLIDKAADFHDSKGNKVVSLGMQAVGVSGVLYAVVQLGLKLLGVV